VLGFGSVCHESLCMVEVVVFKLFWCILFKWLFGLEFVSGMCGVRVFA
jgi:hypothetical protein